MKRLIYILLPLIVCFSAKSQIQINQPYNFNRYLTSKDSINLFTAPSTGDSSNKVPTTAWVKYNIHSGGATIPTLQQVLQSGSIVNINDTIKYINQPYTGYANSFNLLLGKYSQFNIGDSSTGWNYVSCTPNNSFSSIYFSNLWHSTPRTAFSFNSYTNYNALKTYDTTGNSSIGIYPTTTGRNDSVATKYDIRTMIGSSGDSTIWQPKYRSDTARENTYNAINGKGNGTVTSVATGYGLTGGAITTTGTVKVDSTTILPLSTITLNSSGVIHNTPINFTRIGGAWSGTMSLSTQSAYTVFGRGSGSGAPSFITLDSNYFAGGWRNAVSGAMLGYANTWTAANTFSSNPLIISGNQTSAAWGTNGVGLKIQSATYTDASSSGTVTNNYVHTIKSPILAASSATTYSASYTLSVEAPTAGTNVTLAGSSAIYAVGNISTSGNVNVIGQVLAGNSRLTLQGGLLNGGLVASRLGYPLEIYSDGSSGKGIVVFPTTGNIGVGTTTDDASAKLKVVSTISGFLPPSMTGAQAEAINSPTNGLMIFCNNGNGTTITSTGWWGYNSGWTKIH